MVSDTKIMDIRADLNSNIWSAENRLEFIPEGPFK